ncbi:sodium:solute symporter family transporter [Hymenobacter sp. GOD-10R]|uniref:sodium:solute symporter family transporter n=1 Tax=Hymenobacter sp. GOD-10R TaxID=3093922 RepID=UPI002D78CA4C|nr:sodium/solute symporter [Hymenobacter sp. GOD-10R]WRQ28393.1 sodium/solute symporter [Hymenobacter sp. GOD-10R]
MGNNLLGRLTIWDYAIVAAYLVILFAIGYRASFSKKEKTEESLFLANKSLGWASIGFNMWGTNVGPSMLLAFASIGYSTGIVAVNFEWYAFVFLFLLATVFAPRYLAANVSTMPGFMGRQFGNSTQNILAWYALIKILISWLSLGLFSGGVLVRQILGVPMWQSVIVLVLFAGFFTFAGGLKAIAKVNVFQMLLLIGVSLTLTVIGVMKVGGLSQLWRSVPGNYWNLVHPASDPKYPWYAILLGYPVSAVAFFCTDQAMVQSVLGAKSLEQGQLGVNFIGWLKILSLPLFILTGVLCYVLFPHLASPDQAYMTMVTSLFPAGMKGLVIVVLIAVLVGTISSSLNALSTVFAMDVYARNINPNATEKDVVRVGRMTVLVGCAFAVLVALAIDSVKGLNLFDVFQAVLGFIAPPLAVVFLLTVFWRRTTQLAVNAILSWGSAFSLGVGVVYLWVLPPAQYSFWPHYLVLSFCIFAVLFVAAVLLSLLDQAGQERRVAVDYGVLAKPTTRVKALWGALAAVMVVLYFVFNGH